MENFIGKDGFTWWKGVVESNQDPLNLGRCQVRIFGWHPDNKQTLTTADIPWALPINSPNTTMTAGAPIVGDYVFGFFSDGQNAQVPIIIGIFPGIPVNEANPEKGFSEGTHYPIGEPTTSRLYRNDGKESIANTAIGFHDKHIDKGVKAVGVSWDEPKSKYATKPPFNTVTETVAGHVLEFDDTPGAERIHLSHKKDGLTFFEIAPDGSKVTKVQGTNYAIYLKDNNVHITGICNITVDGDANIQVGGNLNGLVNGNVDAHVKGDLSLTVGGNITEKVSGNYTVNAAGNFTVKAAKINLN